MTNDLTSFIQLLILVNKQVPVFVEAVLVFAFAFLWYIMSGVTEYAKSIQNPFDILVRKQCKRLCGSTDSFCRLLLSP